jgi:hypothetical protein
MQSFTPLELNGQHPNPCIPLLFCNLDGLEYCFGCGGQLLPNWVAIERVEIAEGGSPDRGMLGFYHDRCVEEIVGHARYYGDEAVVWPRERVLEIALHPERTERENNIRYLIGDSLEERVATLKDAGILIPDTPRQCEEDKLELGPPTKRNIEGNVNPEQIHTSDSRLNVKSEKKESPTKRVINLILERGELFHTADQDAFICFTFDDHKETLRVSEACVLFAKLYYDTTDRFPSKETINQILTHLTGKAKYEGVELPVFVRIAPYEDRIYLDLGGESWEAVEISPGGWKIVSEVPVRFRRPAGMEALPRPERNGDLGDLRRLLGIQDDDDWYLTLAWLFGTFRPTGPYPILALEGTHGSSKSTRSKALRNLIDPNSAPSRTAPRTEEDLMIAASNSWCLTFDNISSIPPWLSDGLCRLATGGGLSKRRLYSNDSEVLLKAARPVLVNGIDVNFRRGDLLDRTILISLPPISAANRLTEFEFWKRFEMIRPSVLGCLLSAVHGALSHLPHVRLPELPRMADFIVWATAAESGLGIGEGAILAAYNRNRRNSSELALEMSPIVPAIEQLLREGPWEGRSTDLLRTLSKIVPHGVTSGRDWPRNAQRLSASLRRLAPDLRNFGIDFQSSKTPGTKSRKVITLRRLEGES